jgi:hypothetical protein
MRLSESDYTEEMHTLYRENHLSAVNYFELFGPEKDRITFIWTKDRVTGETDSKDVLFSIEPYPPGSLQEYFKFSLERARGYWTNLVEKGYKEMPG